MQQCEIIRQVEKSSQFLPGADSGGGAPGAPPPKKKERERERERERGGGGGGYIATYSACIQIVYFLHVVVSSEISLFSV